MEKVRKASIFIGVLLAFSLSLFSQQYVPVDSLFRSEIPASSSADRRYELGSDFTTLADGFITKARLFSHINEGGEHIVRLWRLDGASYTLVEGPYSWSFSAGIKGWRDFTFPSPVEVQANTTYIISISNSPDLYYTKTTNFQSATSGSYVTYNRGTFSTVLGVVPKNTQGSCYFRDVVFSLIDAEGNLDAGSIGSDQSICYNTAPAQLTELTPPTGGTGTFTYQWQSSSDNNHWTDIPGATLSVYSSPALTQNTYFRRTVTSGIYAPVSSSPVLITVNPLINLAQLHNDITIYSNTSTNLNVDISGGTPPYTINYTQNGIAQLTINNYSSGTDISTGILTTGIYNYALTSVNDANGCEAVSLGTNISVNVIETNFYTPVDSLFRSEIPASSSADRRYELGSDFTTLADGFITKARLFSHINEGGEHIVRLWRLDGASYTLVEGPYSWSFSAGIKGWRDFTFPSPVEVQANTTYIISISNSPDLYYTKTTNFQSATSGSYVTYNRGTFSTVLGVVPKNTQGSCYFRDVVFSLIDAEGNLDAGSIGSDQSICYNTAPAQLTELTPPTGGTGTFTYQWQSSSDNNHWTDIPGATLSVYSSPALTQNTYFRRTVTSGIYAPVSSSPVLITVNPLINLAQLHNDITIYSNTSTNLNVDISGGTPPYTINYTQNGIAQLTINNYSSGTDISTGILTTGIYNYALTSVNDANGCEAVSLGTNISVNVIETNFYTPVDSLFRSEIPASSSADRRYELGSDFTTLADGFITKARLFSHINEGGEHIVRLWRLAGASYTLVEGPYSWSFSAGIKGWRDFTFPSPVEVQANTTYIISISNSPDLYYTKTTNFQSATSGSYVTYNRGTFSTVLGVVPKNTQGSCYFRDVVFSLIDAEGNLDAGSIGSDQSICYNTAPAQLTELTPPTGGTGTFTYQWQSSSDNNHWTDIPGATLSVYSSPALTQNTYFRRTVTSNFYTPVQSTSVLITVFPPVTLAQLHNDITIYSNTSTNFNVDISGGTPPYNINYTRNGITQPTINNYASGTDISTGILTTGIYNYTLTSVNDANGCEAMSLGTNVSVNVIETPASLFTPVDSLFRTETPVLFANDGRYELGSEFITLADGFITKARQFSHMNEGGDHIIRLWKLEDSSYTMIAGPYTWNFSSGIQGWREFTFPTPIPVQRNNTYIVSISNGPDFFYERTENFQSAASGLFVTYKRGTYSAVLGEVPTLSYSSSCYFRDIVFATLEANGSLTAGSVGTDQSICYNTVPAPLTPTTAPIGGTGTYAYQWQSSSNNNVWTDIPGATLSVYSPPALTQNTYFRRTVTSGSYNPVNSNPILITVYQPITLAQLHDNITIISNADTSIYVSISGGTSPFIVDYTRNGVAQATINDYSSGSSISTGVLTSGEFDYALTSVTDANGCEAVSLGTSITITVTDNGNLTSGTIGAPQSICYNNAPSQLTQVIPPTGGTGIYTFQWQRSPENTIWTDIIGATLEEYSPPALTENTYFRRVVTSGTFLPVYSNTVLITIYPQVGIAQLYDNITIISNTDTSINIIITGGDSPFIVNYSRNGIAQSAINDYTSGNSISTGVLTMGVYIYSLTSVSDANGCEAQSLGTNITINVTENGNLTAGEIGDLQSICYNTAPAPLTQLAAPTGGTGVYTFQWQSSADSTLWTDISSATLEDYAPPALTENTYYRRIVTSGSYLPVNSQSVLITVNPQITQAQLHDNISIDENNSTNFYVDITGGIPPYTIDYTRNGVDQTTIDNYINSTYISTGNLQTGGYNYVLTSVTDANGCGALSLGTGISITVNEIPSSLYIPLDSLFRTETPTSSENDNNYELGSEFITLADGVLTKARLFSHVNESGEHIIRLWRNDGGSYTLVAGPYMWSFPAGIQGWRDYIFPNPIEVQGNTTYIISISNGPDLNYMSTYNFQSQTSSSYVSYIRGTYTTVLGEVPTFPYENTCYFRDIVFASVYANGGLTAGSVGSDQSTCYNTVPAQLTELIAPTGGVGTYTFQWQISPNNLVWTDISGATLSEYAPSALTENTYFRRKVTSGSYIPISSNPVLISLEPVITLAQLHDDITIYNNNSAIFNIEISGGNTPFTVNFSRDGAVQPTLENYISGTSISTGILTTGNYIYSLTSVNDATGCDAQNLGGDITVSVLADPDPGLNSNKALVAVNSSSSYYSDYTLYIGPYLDHFGIPYDLVDISSAALPEFSEYALIIFGHKNVYETGYPITQLETSISAGVGLYSFDPHLFDYSSGFSSLTSQESVQAEEIHISNTDHYITQEHAPDIYNLTNDYILLLDYWTVTHQSSLNEGIDLATVSSGGQTIPLLQVSNYGNGKIVKWSGYDWVFENILGPVYGMDDLLWRGIVWAARKPFVMQGLPPMITMRVDDADGFGTNIKDNFGWIKICNEFGIIPWCGTFNNTMPTNYIPTLKSLIDKDSATASPHAFGGNPEFIYYNHNNIPSFDAAANVRLAREFYEQNGLEISNYIVPHYYEISSDALPEVRDMGVEFLAIQMLHDNDYGAPWINCAPFRVNRYGLSHEVRPVYYGGKVTLNGINFFNCLTEIRDDGSYEWFPNNDVSSTASRGIRHLRRSINSMVMSSLFTHENFFNNITSTNFREILGELTSSISEYDPEYTSTDYAVQYIRAKTNLKITDIRETLSSFDIYYSGNNDMNTKCYLFTEENGQIVYRFVELPQINGNNIISVIK